MYEIPFKELKKIADELKFANGKKIMHEFYQHTETENSLLIPISELQQPKREGNRTWFRSKENIINILTFMISEQPLPPIEVFSKGRKIVDKYSIRDGFHRYYASAAIGFTLIPIMINDWEFEDAN